MVSPIENDPNAPLPFGFTEFKESGDEEYGWIENNFKATRIFDGPWNNRIQFIAALANGNYEVNGHPVDFPPASHPVMLGISALSAKVKGLLSTDIDRNNNYIKHTMARITVDYGVFKGNGGSPQDPEKGNNPFIEEKIDSSIELLPIKAQRRIYTGETSRSKLQSDDPIVAYEDQPDTNGNLIPLYPSYADGQTYHDFEETVEETIHFKNIILNYKFLIPLVLQPLWGNIQDALGCVNSVTFTTPSGLVAIPGTLLYGGISGITKRELLKGRLGWQLEHSFQYKKQKWNYRPQGDYAGKGQTQKAVIAWIEIKPHLYDSYPLQKVYRNLSSEEQQLLNEARNAGGVGN